MPFTRTDTPTDGQTMVWSLFADNFDGFRSWVNDVDVGDVEDNAVRREHLVRPVLGQYELASPFQQAASAHYALDEPDALAPSEWGARVQRFSIFPVAVPGVSGRWVLPVGRTVYVPVTRTIEVSCSFEVQIRSDIGAGSYPDGAGGPVSAERAGYFSLFAYNRGTGVEYEDLAGQHVYGLDNNSASSTDEYVDKVVVELYATFSAASYDFFLVYQRQSTSSDVEQLDVSRVSWMLKGL